MSISFSEQDIRVFDRIVEARRSIRVFKEEPPPDSMIRAVIHAGIYAPYAALALIDNMDFRRFFVIRKGSGALDLMNGMIKETARLALERLERDIQDKPLLRERSANFRQRLTSLSQEGFPRLKEVPSFIVVGERRGMPPAEKESLAHVMQNMWLKATVLGLGFRLVSIVENLAESQQFCKLLGVPYGEFAFNGCIIGYSARDPAKRKGISEEGMVTWL